MDSSEVVYSKTERSVYMSFMTLVMLGLSWWLFRHPFVPWYYGSIWVLPWVILVPCFFNPLKVWVTGENLEARLGFGFLKKTIPLAEIKSIKAIDVPWHSRKNIWVCFNSRALQIINHDDDVFQFGSTDPETLASFIEN